MSRLALLLLVGFALSVFGLAAIAQVTIQFAFVLDGSSSLSDDDWSLMRNGLAAAVEDPACFPQDGSVELTVIQFAFDARVELGPVVVSSSTASDLATLIRGMIQMTGGTCISCGVHLAADTLRSSPNYRVDVRQAINLVTDGEPNYCSDGSPSGYRGTFCALGPAEASAEGARNHAVFVLAMTEDDDEFDAEFIGTQGTASDWLRDSMVWPHPGYYAPPLYGSGWVRVVEDPAEFAATLCEKFEVITQPASLVVVKQVLGDAPATNWTFAVRKLPQSTPLTEFELPAGGSSQDISRLLSGSYTVSMEPKDGYTTVVGETEANQIEITLARGERKTVVFVSTADRPEMSLSKIADNVNPAVGSTVVFTVTVANQGAGSASQVEVTDTLPSGYTYVSHTASHGTYSNATGVWAIGSLAPSTTVSLRITATVLAAGDRTNVAYADWAENTGNPLSASATTTPVSPSPPPPPPPSGGGSGGNLTPVASAGRDQIVCVGERVVLDASHSFDPDGISGEERIAEDYTGHPRVFSDLSFDWAFSTWYYRDGQPVPQYPEGSRVTDTAEGFDTPFASFVPDVPGDYVLSVIVSDAAGAWSIDQITLRAVVCTQTYICSYPAGLHLLSLPAQPIDPSASAILDSLDADLPPLTYQSGFTAADTLSPLEGVWVRFAESTSLSVVGREIQEDVTICLEEPGWHLISSPFTIEWDRVMVWAGGALRFVYESVARSRIDEAAICYDPLDEVYRIAQELDPCHGYWVRTHQPDVVLVLRWNHRMQWTPSAGCGCAGSQAVHAVPAPPSMSLWEPSADLTLIAYPNPASTSATIRLFLPDGVTDPEVWIYDMTGRLVLHQALDDRDTQMQWDLQNEDGEPVASGLYFCVITAKGEDSRTLRSEVFRLLVAR